MEPVDTDRMGQCRERHSHCTELDRSQLLSSGTEHTQARREPANEDVTGDLHHPLPWEHWLKPASLGLLTEAPVGAAGHMLQDQVAGCKPLETLEVPAALLAAGQPVAERLGLKLPVD
jgi:hypothetical protein